MAPKIGLIFSVMPKTTATWPHMGFDYEARVSYLSNVIRESLPGMEFEEQVVENPSEFEDNPSINAYAVVLVGIWNGVPARVAQTGKPTLLIDDLYGGSGEFLETLAWAGREGLKVAGIASSNPQDIKTALWALTAVSEVSRSKLLIVKHMEHEAFDKIRLVVKERVGAELILVKPEELTAEYEKADELEAERLAERWITRALAVIEPSKAEIIKSARMYIAMKRLVEKYGAQGITIDCLGLFYTGKLPAYPCLGFVELLNQGIVGACEADIDSALTQLLIQFATGRPGFISDPVIDVGAKQIIYAHCLAPTKVYGGSGPEAPYKIRSHAEDRAGAALQAYWPPGEPVTTVKLNLEEKAMAIHGGIICSNVEEEKACRTKVASTAEVENILDNWNRDARFGWHRVSVVGDYRKLFKIAARLLGFKIIEEDACC